MTTQAAAMFLEVNFDIHQISETLEWKFWRRDNDGNPHKGKDAGIINFTVNEPFHLQITAGSYRPFDNFRVVDCVMITRPYIYRCGPDVATEYAPPSPFLPQGPGQTMGATFTFPDDEFKLKTEEDHQIGYFRRRQVWTDHLTVGGFTGRWEIYFVLTVEIPRNGLPPELRVFSFDPEGTVTTGEDSPEAVSASLMPEGTVTTGAD